MKKDGFATALGDRPGYDFAARTPDLRDDSRKTGFLAWECQMRHRVCVEACVGHFYQAQNDGPRADEHMSWVIPALDN